MTSPTNESSGLKEKRSEARPRPCQVEEDKEVEEGCPVIEEFGTVCGETNTLRIFKDFRKYYDECMRKLESDSADTLEKTQLAPFKKLFENLWEQNEVLVETVEELEQEATGRVTMLQNKLEESNEKDIKNLLKKKDREINCLTKDIAAKNEVLRKYCNEIEELKSEIRAKNNKMTRFSCQVKESAMERLRESASDLTMDGEELSESEIEFLFNAIVKGMDEEKTKLTKQMEESECIIRQMREEKCREHSEKCDIIRRLEEVENENNVLKNELACYKCLKAENESLLSGLEQTKSKRDELQCEVNSLTQSMQDLDKNFKETRWALTAEIAEKHDQIMELKRYLGSLEEQVRQAGMKTLFKDGVIKGMRKELKNSRKVVCPGNEMTKTQFHIPNSETSAKLWHFDVPVKEHSDEDIKLDIRIFPIPENETIVSEYCKYSSEKCSLKIQTEKKLKPLSKMRNVSTQHTTKELTLPRSVGTLKVLPWSGEEVSCKSRSPLPAGRSKCQKGSYQIPCSNMS